MHKLIVVWLMGAAVLAPSPLDTAGARPAGKQAVRADARIEQFQANRDEEDEEPTDDDGSENEPGSQGDEEGDED